MTPGTDEEVKVLVNITPPEGTVRSPSDICCVIDISGSMGAEAVIQNQSGATEGFGLSLLDVAKHGVRTILHSLGPKDRLSIVTFENQATTVCELKAVDESGMKEMDEMIDALQSGGGTDIWRGLEAGLNALTSKAEAGRFSHIMLLTDGRTSYADMVIPNMTDYKAKHERLPGTVNTFGFGYNIDSPLLTKISEFGGGSYSFIPDAGFVGTAFVNNMSSLLATYAANVRLTLDTEESGSKILGVVGGYKTEGAGSAHCVAVGSMQYGQSRGIVVRMTPPKEEGTYLVASVSCEFKNGTNRDNIFAEGKTSDAPVPLKVGPEVCRSEYVDMITAAMDAAVGSTRSLEAALKLIKELSSKIKASESKSDEKVVALLADIDGQTTEAFSKDEYWNKWGLHYIPSIMMAHKMQQCNNFKDPGVQVYGGKLFQEVRDEADGVFNDLPAPKPSARRPSQTYSSAPVSMSAFNDRYGG